jgi:hypothetical protein
MKRRLVVLMLASIALNVVLAAISLQAATQGRFESSAFARGDISAKQGASSIPPDAAASATDAKIALLLELEQRYLADAEHAAKEYWRSAPEQEQDHGRSVLDAQDRIRSELIASLGPEASGDAVFRQLFRPLDPRYAFLSSAQQLAVQRLRYERDAELREIAGPVAPPGERRHVGTDAARAINERYLAGLAALLDRATLFEFLLRDSPLAQQLRTSHIALSEREFRAVFEVLWSLEDTATDIDAVLAARAELKSILGEARFARFWAARDPLYSRVEAAATRHGVNAATVAAIYAVMVDFQDRQMRAALAAGSDPARAAMESGRLAEDERARIAGIIGPELAAELLADRAAASFRLLDDSAPRSSR